MRSASFIITINFPCFLGQVQYDAIVKQGANRNKIVQSTLNDLKEKEAVPDLVSLPNDIEEQETAERLEN